MNGLTYVPALIAVAWGGAANAESNCKTDISGSWRLQLSHPAGSGIMRFSGMMLDREKSQFILFIEQSYSNSSMGWRTASLQTCAQVLNAAETTITCKVENSIPPGYHPDNFRFKCIASERMTADIVDARGRVVLANFLFTKDDWPVIDSTNL